MKTSTKIEKRRLHNNDSSYRHMTLWILAPLVLLTACLGADFSGNSSHQNQNALARAYDPSGSPQNGNGSGSGANSTDANSASGQIGSTGTGGGNNPTNKNGSGDHNSPGQSGSGSGSGTNINGDTPSLGGNGPNLTSNGSVPACQPNMTPGNYNIMFVFDKTGSQLVTDPTLVRRSGALQFLDKLYNYVGTYPSAKIYAGVLAFDTASIRSANGWLPLDNNNKAAIQQEITTATSNPFGLTAYSPVLTDAASYFDQINQQTDKTTTRNYIIFLTDGLPDFDTPTAISAAVNNLVTNDGVAIIAVAAGPAVPAVGDAVVSSLAQPTNPTLFPDHVGRYFKAPDAASFQSAWDQIFTSIAGCTVH
jgi:hypothetical protein